MHGIPKDEIPIARYHKIEILRLLRSFLESGAQTVDEYNMPYQSRF